MGKAILLARLFLLFLSCYGYFQILRRSVRTEFCPGLLFSCIGSVLFFAGILNLLRPAAWALFFVGLYLAGDSIKRRQSVADMLCPGLLFFMLLSVCFFFLLYGSKLFFYDSFTHWARATRTLITNHRFPSFKDPSILFASYPLGSAIFIYYFAEITGLSYEWAQMFAQAMLLLSMVMGLFACVKGVFPSVVIAVCCLFLLCDSYGTVNDLSVDKLLALTALNAVVFCAYYGKGLKDRLFQLLPYIVFLMNIKNSAVLFVIVLLIYIWLTLRKEQIPVKTWLLLFAVPIMTLVLWKAHVSLVFSGDMLGPHSMSISLFISRIQEKQASDIPVIFRMLAQETFSLSNRALWVLFAGLLICLFAKLSAPRETCREITVLYLLCVLSYVLYQLGTAGMYLFSMTRMEALRLASYDRYHATILMFVTPLTVLMAAKLYAAPHTLRTQSCLSACLLLCALVLSYYTLSPMYPSYQWLHTEKADRSRFDRLIDQYHIIPGGSYLILVKDTDAGFTYYMSQYLLESQDVTVVTAEEIDSINSSKMDYDYIIAFDESEEAMAFLSGLSEGYSEPVFCLY